MRTFIEGGVVVIVTLSLVLMILNIGYTAGELSGEINCRLADQQEGGA